MRPTSPQIRHIDYSMITQTNKAVAIFNTDLHFIEGSKKWIKIHGLKEEKIVEKHILDIFPKTTKEWKLRYKKCLKGKFLKEKEVKYIGVNGAVRWFRWGIRPWRNYEGEIAGILVKSKDITRAKLNNSNAKRDKKLLEEIGQVSRVGGWEYDVVTKQLFWTSVTKEIHGVDKDYVPTIENAIDFLINKNDRKKTNHDINEAIVKGRPYNVELKIKTAQGEERWVNTNGKAEFKNGKCIRLYGTVQDIDARKSREIKIARSEERFRKTFDNAITGMAIIDPVTYCFKQVNQNACQIFGYSKDELAMLSLSDLSILGNIDKSITALKQLRRGEVSSFIVEEKYHNKRGQSICVEFGASAIRDIENKVVNYICQIRDITELKQKEKSLKKFISVTQNQNKRLVNFTHIVSHNLRSHSSNFKMLLDLYQVETDINEKNKIISLLNMAGNKLEETIGNLNEVLVFNSDINKTREPTNLRRRVTKVKSNIEELIQKNNVTIINNIPENMSISAVPAYIDSILLNLITNSIKYQSPERDPIIKVDTVKVDDYIVLSVADNGKGIDLKRHGHKLFGMYKTFHGNKDARGIGLFMTKNQVEVMNGRIEAESKPEEGAVFKIYLNEKN